MWFTTTILNLELCHIYLSAIHNYTFIYAYSKSTIQCTFTVWNELKSCDWRTGYWLQHAAAPGGHGAAGGGGRPPPQRGRGSQAPRHTQPSHAFLLSCHLNCLFCSERNGQLIFCLKLQAWTLPCQSSFKMQVWAVPVSLYLAMPCFSLSCQQNCLFWTKRHATCCLNLRSEPVLGICDILVRIRIRLHLRILLFSSVIFKMTTKFFFTMFFVHFFLTLHLQNFSKLKLKVIKKSQNRRNDGFSYFFCLMIEGSGSGGGPKTSQIRIPQHWSELFQSSFKLTASVSFSIRVLNSDEYQSLCYRTLRVWLCQNKEQRGMDTPELCSQLWRSDVCQNHFRYVLLLDLLIYIT